jgi:hypothetical protein
VFDVEQLTSLNQSLLLQIPEETVDLDSTQKGKHGTASICSFEQANDLTRVVPSDSDSENVVEVADEHAARKLTISRFN